MDQYIEMVKAFHRKHGYPIGLLPGVDPQQDMLRIQLTQEELAELTMAIINKDLVGIADGVADLTWVVLGTAAHFGMPLGELFIELDRSNMSKDHRRLEDVRLRDKGPNYKPADFARVLRERIVLCSRCNRLGPLWTQASMETACCRSKEWVPIAEFFKDK